LEDLYLIKNNNPAKNTKPPITFHMLHFACYSLNSFRINSMMAIEIKRLTEGNSIG
jgi:hypothetical protein